MDPGRPPSRWNDVPSGGREARVMRVIGRLIAALEAEREPDGSVVGTALITVYAERTLRRVGVAAMRRHLALVSDAAPEMYAALGREGHLVPVMEGLR